MNLRDITADVDLEYLTYGHFRITECAGGWEWAHKQWRTNGAQGVAPTLFAAIAAADQWLASSAVDGEAA